MADLDRFAKSEKVHPARVLKVVAETFRDRYARKFTVDGLLGTDDTDHALVGARAIAIYLLTVSDVSDLALSHIPQIFGRPPSVVQALHESIVERRRDDKKFGDILGRLIEELAKEAILGRKRVAASAPELPDEKTAEAARRRRREVVLQVAEERLRTGGEPRPAPVARPAARRAPEVPAARVSAETTTIGGLTVDRKYTTLKPADRQAAMLEILKRFGSISPGRLGAELKARGMDLSRETIRKDMEALIAAQGGQVTVSGSRKSRCYTIGGRAAAKGVPVPAREPAPAPAARPRAAAARRKRVAASVAGPSLTALMLTTGARGVARRGARGGAGDAERLLQLSSAGRNALEGVVEEVVARLGDASKAAVASGDPARTREAEQQMLVLQVLLRGMQQ